MCLLSLGLISGLSQYNYNSYLTTYGIAQKKELVALYSKYTELKEGLNRTLIGNGIRLKGAKGDLPMIKGIVNAISHTRLKNHLLPFQKVTYYSLTQPYIRVNRFGSFPLSPSDVPSSIGKRDPIILFREGVLIGQISLFVQEAEKELLEVQVSEADLAHYFSHLSYLELRIPAIQNNGKLNFSYVNPLSYRKFLLEHTHEYMAFALLAIICFLLLIMSTRATKKWALGFYADRLQALEAETIQQKETLVQLETDAEDNSSEFQALEESRRLELDFQNRIQTLICSRTVVMYSILERVKHSLEEGHTNLSPDEQYMAIDAVVQELKPLSLGAWKSETTDPIDLTKLIQDVLDLFSYKIHTMDIQIESTFEDINETVYDDPLLFKLVMLNIIGKALFHIPTGGWMTLELTQNDDLLSLIIKDNGFENTQKMEKYINEASPLFIQEKALRALCIQIRGAYSKRRLSSEENVSTFQINLNQEENHDQKVIQFRQK